MMPSGDTDLRGPPVVPGSAGGGGHSCGCRTMRVVGRVCLALVGILLVLLSAEAAFRWLPNGFRRRTVPLSAVKEGFQLPSGCAFRRAADPRMGFELTSEFRGTYGGQDVEINSLGMRDREYERDPPPDTFRIAAVGDSFTFGFGVDAASSYPKVLERLLISETNAPASFEVMNFGVPGYQACHEEALVESKVLPLDPDIILVGYYLNDPCNDCPEPELAADLRAFAAERQASVKAWQAFRDRTAFSHLLRYLAEARIERLSRIRDKDFFHTADKHWSTVVAYFDMLREAAASRGSRIVLVVFPETICADSWARYPYAWIHEKVIHEGRRHGFHCIDLLPVFRGFDIKSLEIPGDGHPNEFGHSLAAATIYESLVAGRLLPEGAIATNALVEVAVPDMTVRPFAEMLEWDASRFRQWVMAQLPASVAATYQPVLVWDCPFVDGGERVVIDGTNVMSRNLSYEPLQGANVRWLAEASPADWSGARAVALVGRGAIEAMPGPEAADLTNAMEVLVDDGTFPGADHYRFALVLPEQDP